MYACFFGGFVVEIFDLYNYEIKDVCVSFASLRALRLLCMNVKNPTASLEAVGLCFGYQSSIFVGKIDSFFFCSIRDAILVKTNYETICVLLLHSIVL